MSRQVELSEDNHGWFGLGHFLGRRVTIRASRIDKKKKRVKDTDGHHVDEAYAQGGVKIRPKGYDISNFGSVNNFAETSE